MATAKKSQFDTYYVIEYVGKYSARGNYYNGSTKIGEEWFVFGLSNAKRYDDKKKADAMKDKLQTTFFGLKQFKVVKFVDTIEAQRRAFKVVNTYLKDNGYLNSSNNFKWVSARRSKSDSLLHEIAYINDSSIRVKGGNAHGCFIISIDSDKLTNMNDDILKIADALKLEY